MRHEVVVGSASLQTSPVRDPSLVEGFEHQGRYRNEEARKEAQDTENRTFKYSIGCKSDQRVSQHIVKQNSAYAWSLRFPAGICRLHGSARKRRRATSQPVSVQATNCAADDKGQSNRGIPSPECNHRSDCGQRGANPPRPRLRMIVKLSSLGFARWCKIRHFELFNAMRITCTNPPTNPNASPARNIQCVLNLWSRYEPMI